METINLDPSEISKFDEMAFSWWDENGPCQPLHALNPYRLQFIQQHCQLRGKKILDVGCGGGILSESLAAAEATVTGIDCAQKALQVARLHLQESKREVDYQHSTAEDFAKNHAGQYDVVTCLELLEHVPEPLSLIQAVSALVRPGGDVFFSTLNRNPKAYLYAILGAEYVLKVLPKGTHDFEKFIKPSELSSWCRAAGLSLNALTGMHYNPMAKTFSLSNDVSVNYMIHCKHVDSSIN